MKVSICIPAYNHPIGLQRLLYSIALQDYQDYEIIISDDSTDSRCFQVVNSFIKDNDLAEKVIYHKNERILGSPANWNRAIELASGEYVKIMHHDDLFVDPRALSLMTRALQDAGDGHILSCASVDIKGGKRVQANYLTSSDILKINEFPGILLCGNIIGAPSTIMWRATSLKFDERLVWLVDVDFYIRFLNMAKLIVLRDELVHIHVGEEGQITRACLLDTPLMMKEHFLVFQSIKSDKKYDSKFKEMWINLFIYSNARNMDFISELCTGSLDVAFVKNCYRKYKSRYLFHIFSILKFVIKRNLHGFFAGRSQ